MKKLLFVVFILFSAFACGESFENIVKKGDDISKRQNTMSTKFNEDASKYDKEIAKEMIARNEFVVAKINISLLSLGLCEVLEDQTFCDDANEDLNKADKELIKLEAKVFEDKI